MFYCPVLNQSIRDCLNSRATSRLIVCIRNAGSDDKEYCPWHGLEERCESSSVISVSLVVSPVV